jgi:hypothetical protein
MDPIITTGKMSPGLQPEYRMPSLDAVERMTAALVNRGQIPLPLR